MTNNDQSAVMERRVLIAKDVLHLLEKQKIKPEINRYFDLDYNTKSSYRGMREEASLSDFFKKKMKTCEACAVGSLFVATVLRYNEVTVGSVDLIEANVYQNLAHTMKRLLWDYFDKLTLARIEAVYEGWVHWITGGTYYGAHDPELIRMIPLVEAVRNANPSPTRRMTWVMETIIEQGGLFEPWKTKDYQDWLKETPRE